MRATNSLARWCWAACVLGTLGLQAQDAGITSSFRVRGGLQVGDKKDGLDNRMMGFGLEIAVPVASGHVFGELGYQYKSGTQFLSNLGSMARANGATIDASQSVESVKNKLDGIEVRLGYGAGINQDWSWRAGLQLGGAKFTHEVAGYISDGPADGENTTYIDSYTPISTKNSIAVSPFAGVTYNLNKESALEVGVLLLSYKALSYQHVAGTVRVPLGTPVPDNSWGGHTSQDSLKETNRMLPHLEFAYVFRF